MGKISKWAPRGLQCTLDTQSQLSQLVYKQLLDVPPRNWDTVEEGMEDHLNTCVNTATVWSLIPSHQSLLPQNKSSKPQGLLRHWIPVDSGHWPDCPRPWTTAAMQCKVIWSCISWLNGAHSAPQLGGADSREL